MGGAGVSWGFVGMWVWGPISKSPQLFLSKSFWMHLIHYTTMTKKGGRKKSKNETYVVIDGDSKVFIEKERTSGREDVFFRPRDIGLMRCTHIIKFPDYTCNYHVDVHTTPSNKVVEEHTEITYAHYLEINDKMKKKADFFKIVW